ncbi:NAD(P)-binding protein [Rubrivivax sp. RP6-9]|uniref:NAD(P)-binding protein n=1 Tax=Rubrivivax sp. RP6-9 TaxID=3415750 RepID=UPI003CC55E64
MTVRDRAGCGLYTASQPSKALEDAMRQADTDNLIIGAGATGLAFADTLLSETGAHITLVDRHGKPGGHWNDAHAFVTLHQPSSFYGVASMELGSGLKDAVGLNRGMAELASGPEVSGYFDRVMNHRLLASGRVRYHPLSNYLGEIDGLSAFESLPSGERTQVRVRRKIVDATFFSPSVPSTHTPAFAVGEGVRPVAPNAPGSSTAWARRTVRSASRRRSAARPTRCRPSPRPARSTTCTSGSRPAARRCASTAAAPRRCSTWRRCRRPRSRCCA